jgi:large subunit ribosomal protein L30
VAKIKITLIKSASGNNNAQKMTLQALGLRRLNQSVVKEDSRSLRGQVMKVRHLITIEEEENAAK